MTPKKSLVAGLGEQLRAQSATIIGWLVVIVVIYGAVQYNAENRAKTVANLSSSDATVRDAEILKWANQGRLADALALTQDPNSDDKSPQNVESAAVRTICATDFDTMAVAGKVPLGSALDNLYALHKDTVIASIAKDGIAALGAQSDAHLSAVVSHLADGDPDVRSASSDALAKIGNSCVVAMLVDAVNGRPAGAKDDALTTMTAVGKLAGPSVAGLLTEPDDKFRATLLTMLAQIASPDTIPAIKAQALAVPRNATLRRLALLALASVVSEATMPGQKIPPTAADLANVKSASPILVEAVTDQTDDSRARAECAIALGDIPSPAAISALVKALSDTDSRIASAASSGLQSCGASAIPSLASALTNPDERVRADAANALGGIGTAQSLGALTPAYSDPSSLVRRSACEALGRTANPAVIAPLISRLSDKDGFVAGAASSSLSYLGKPAVPALVAALGSSNVTTPIYAMEALQAIGPDALPSVIDAAQTGSQSQKTWCAVVLGRLHDESAEPVLKHLASSSNASTKFAATQALDQVNAA